MSLTNQILERWPEGIELQDYPELMDLIMKSIFRNGRWETSDGKPDPKEIRRLMECVESGQAPAVRASLSFAEQRKLEQLAGAPVSNYSDFEKMGFTLEKQPSAPQRPTMTQRVTAKLKEDLPKFQIPQDLAKRMAAGERFVTETDERGRIQFVPAPPTQPTKSAFEDDGTVGEDETIHEDNEPIVTRDMIVEAAVERARTRHGR